VSRIVRIAFAACLLICAGAAQASGAAVKGPSKMQLQPPLEARLQALRPALLAGDQAALDQAESAIAESRQQGLLVLAPASIPSGGALPVVVVHQRSSMRGWEVIERENLGLLLWHPGSGTLRAAPAVLDPKSQEYRDPDARRPPRPPESATQTLNTGATRYDLKAKLAVLAGGPQVVFALAYDWISPPAVVQVQGGPVGAAASAADIPNIGNAKLPSFEPTRHHPPAPAREGLAFKVERLSDGHHVLLGTLRKPAAPEELLAHPQPMYTAAGPRQVVALVRVGVAAATLDQPVPTTMNLVVPVFGPAALAPGQPLEARLSVDLSPLGKSSTPGRYPVYVFMAGRAYGPQPLLTP
jgi:hypothetical protein